MDSEKIGALIEKKRKEKKLTQEELAKKLYVSNKTISKWETGKGIPSIDLLLPLSEVLDIDIKELLTGKENVLFDELKNKKKKRVINLIIGITICLFLCFLEVILYVSNVSSKNAIIIFISFIIILLIIDIGNYFLNQK